jgi:hypothetical protein
VFQLAHDEASGKDFKSESRMVLRSHPAFVRGKLPLRQEERCQLNALKNPKFLPEKWAKTSVVGKLQPLHNQNA